MKSHSEIESVIKAAPVVECDRCHVAMTLRKLEPLAADNSYEAIYRCPRCTTESQCKFEAFGSITKSKGARLAAFLYRCPSTGQNVQGWRAEEVSDDAAVEAVNCIACARVHLIDPKTGRVLASDD